MQPDLGPGGLDAFKLSYLELYRQRPLYKSVGLGGFWAHWATDDLPAYADVHRRIQFKLVTIPSLDSGEVFEARHTLSRERIINNTKLDESVVAADEKWRGDVRDDGNLKDKLLLEWRKNDYNRRVHDGGEREPTKELLDRGAVISEKSTGLKFRVSSTHEAL
ncbi:hypothetical protein BU23DRAFT_570230 [Bimuria novae-zelandiae CBS 107.79]|uniref:Uncharacterized protein n=1 Tax=Bimuria novae-zelandiae CBS 107.79 TaxID=1447943 RepID=A0A6A5V1J0_9PLEO|nr:hypothetical protein BU23DRAFT_570230 [Bimuria novae-zelandiae CBS 107.79]